MLLRSFGIEHTLSEGENVIEFTPSKSGTFQYTCWMGMIRGNITVTDTLKLLQLIQIQVQERKKQILKQNHF